MCHSVLTDRRGKSVLGVDHIDRAGALTRAFNRGDRALEFVDAEQRALAKERPTGKAPEVLQTG